MSEALGAQMSLENQLLKAPNEDFQLGESPAVDIQLDNRVFTKNEDTQSALLKILGEDF